MSLTARVLYDIVCRLDGALGIVVLLLLLLLFIIIIITQWRF